LGNCGFAFFSFGQSAKSGQKKADEWNQMRRAPVDVMAVTEATDELQEFLESPSVKLPHIQQGPLQHRRDKQWITMKGQEKSGSPLLAVDDRSGGRLELVWWEKKVEGTTKGIKRYSRVLICKVLLEKTVVGLGSSFNVMVLHVHNMLAHEQGEGKRNKYFKWFDAMLEKYDVKVVLGDFNMMMFSTLSRCRSGGMTIDTAAYYTFKLTPNGAPAADSCAGFFVNCPGSYTLLHGLSAFNDSEGGILREGRHEDYDTYRPKGMTGGFPGAEAPGYPLGSYWPRDATNQAKMREFLTPSDASHEIAVAVGTVTGRRKTKTGDGKSMITVRQKHAAKVVWQGHSGEQRMGSHMPLFFYAEGANVRSPAAKQKRSAAYWSGIHDRTRREQQQPAFRAEAQQEHHLQGEEAVAAPAPAPAAAAAAAPAPAAAAAEPQWRHQQQQQQQQQLSNSSCSGSSAAASADQLPWQQLQMQPEQQHHQQEGQRQLDLHELPSHVCYGAGQSQADSVLTHLVGADAWGATAPSRATELDPYYVPVNTWPQQPQQPPQGVWDGYWDEQARKEQTWEQRLQDAKEATWKAEVAAQLATNKAEQEIHRVRAEAKEEKTTLLEQLRIANERSSGWQDSWGSRGWDSRDWQG